MDIDETTPSVPDRQRSGGGVAVAELAELLQLRLRPVISAVAAVVLLGVVLTVVAPGAVPATALTGLVVGMLALVAAVATAVAVDAADPVLRGPRHLRRDGHAVLGRLAGPDVSLHGGALVETLGRRLGDVDRLRLAVTGAGADPSAVARGIGRALAAEDHTVLVIDLRAVGRGHGAAEVGAKVMRLGEAATLADDRPYAWLGAGADAAAAARTAAEIAARPPRDLQLLLVVAPDDPLSAPDVLASCDRTLVLVPADRLQRGLVTSRLEALRNAGASPECVVVGGAAVQATGRAETVEVESAPSGASPGSVRVTPGGAVAAAGAVEATAPAVPTADGLGPVTTPADDDEDDAPSVDAAVEDDPRGTAADEPEDTALAASERDAGSEGDDEAPIVVADQPASESASSDDDQGGPGEGGGGTPTPDDPEDRGGGGGAAPTPATDAAPGDEAADAAAPEDEAADDAPGDEAADEPRAAEGEAADEPIVADDVAERSVDEAADEAPPAEHGDAAAPLDVEVSDADEGDDASEADAVDAVDAIETADPDDTADLAVELDDEAPVATTDAGPTDRTPPTEVDLRGDGPMIIVRPDAQDRRRDAPRNGDDRPSAPVEASEPFHSETVRVIAPPAPDFAPVDDLVTTAALQRLAERHPG